MSPSKVEALLSELCIQLGFCLTSREIARLSANPPRDIDAFVDAVFEAEGIDGSGSRHLRRQVRDSVASHFRRWEDETTGSLPLS